MFRKLSLALAISAALLPMGAFGLGLGEIKTKSSLNERFDATIAMVSVDAGEIETIKANLATSVDFARAGLERPFLLSKLRFKSVILPSGKAAIRVTTEDPVREPFLNFLVEVNWPKGRMLREFTVLLDPPVTMASKPAPVQAPTTATKQRVKRPAPQRPRASTPTASPQPIMSADASEYGPVRRGSTLWGVAKDLGVQGATVEQVMMSLYRDNPRAFVRNDINMLKAGVMLRVRPQDEMTEQSAKQARRDFHDEASGKRTTPPPRSQRQDQLRIAAARKDTEKAALSEPPREDIERVKSDLMIVKETSESTRQETEELRTRIRELESQLADIGQLLKLKSQQLADLQSDDVPPLVEESKPEPVAVPEPEAVVAPEPEPEPVETPAVVETPEPQPAPVEATVQPEIKPEPKPVVAPKPAPKPAPTPDQPEPDPLQDLIDQVMGNTTMLAIGGALVVVVLSLLWLLLRRRREAEEEFQESVLINPATGDGTTLELVEGEEDEGLGQKSGEHHEETSFISDFSPSDIDALQEETGEVDPAAEADVYIAYGRYQQAESLINQAIDKAPERLDLKLKLLEIYFTTRNTASFTQLAEELDAAGASQRDPQLWERVQSMGQELVPGHPLFGSAGDGEAVAAAAVVPQSGDSESLCGLDLDLDTEMSELSENSLGTGDESEGLPDGAVLNVPDAISGLETAAPQDTQRMPKLTPDDTVRMQKSAAPELPISDTLDESEFSLDLQDIDSLEDIDLGDLGDDSLSVPSKMPDPLDQPMAGRSDLDQPFSAPNSGMLDEREIPSISLDDLEAEASEPIAGAQSEMLSDLLQESPSHAEEVETKLDLARAYMEMGDGDGAREILDEVLKEGDAKQKGAAQGLIDEIG